MIITEGIRFGAEGASAVKASGKESDKVMIRMREVSNVSLLEINNINFTLICRVEGFDLCH